MPAMDVTPLLDPLNEQQREAVTLSPGPALVLAGAGSGKTRVLVHRIAWLIAVEGVSPLGIMAMTFTNKAAAEMRGRAESLLGMSVSGMWVGTFHGLAHRLLRAHWQDAGLPQTFQILDADDQYRLVRRVLRSLELDESRWPPRRVQGHINARKEEGLRADRVQTGKDPGDGQMAHIYATYEEACRRAGVVDFAELLLRSLELLRGNASLLEHYRGRFQHLLVDEFQDTNDLQYAWLRLLAGDRRQVFAVGDDDQSIYGWRGARIEHIQDFSKDFPDTRIIRLERNYRSTETILQAANHLIGHNEGRLGKELWTEGSTGDPLVIYEAFDDRDEARFVAERVRYWTEQGHGRSEIAVLYRSNAQSRVLEEAFVALGIPYRVYGGQRFFERAEIKDALAYLRLLANRDDDASFERVVNQPPRGVGERTMVNVRDYARRHGTSLWAAAQALVARGGLTTRAANALRGFLEGIDGMARTPAGSLKDRVEQVVAASGLKDHYAKEKGERGQARVENLDELVSAAQGFEYDPDEHGDMDELGAFLAHAALESGQAQGDAWEDCVQLMTLHSAKGLEFPLVFLCGMEEGLFPHQMSMAEPSRLEEERRLCYVGLTRAQRQVILTYAQQRRLHGADNANMPSRFIGELPAELVEEVRPRAMMQRPVYRTDRRDAEESESGMRIGARVRHRKFGEGVVVDYEGSGDHARVQVNFEQVGSKWLVLSYARLEPA